MKILAVGPHPDDVEFGCAPVLIQEVQNGHQVRILVLSKGEAASSGTPEERAQEARDAAGSSAPKSDFLDLGGDCHIRHTPENAFAIAREIRWFQPNIVLAPHLDENQHPDHAAAGRMVRDAARLARYGGLTNLKDLPCIAIGSVVFLHITQTSWAESGHRDRRQQHRIGNGKRRSVPPIADEDQRISGIWSRPGRGPWARLRRFARPWVCGSTTRAPGLAVRFDSVVPEFLMKKLAIGITCYPSVGGSGIVASQLGSELAKLGIASTSSAMNRPSGWTWTSPMSSFTTSRSMSTSCSSIRTTPCRWR